MAVVRNHSWGAYTYLRESDLYFPHLTVSQILQFAAQVRPLVVLNAPLKRMTALQTETILRALLRIRYGACKRLSGFPLAGCSPFTSFRNSWRRPEY